MWRKLILAGISLALAILLAGCDSGAYSKNMQGNELFDEGKLDEALEAYQNAQVEDPDAPQPHYNAGNVLHEQQAYSEAITETLNALNGADSALQSWVDYNVGNSEFRLKQYEQAIEQYKAALRANPDDADAKLNLEIAQQRLEQQQQDQQQQDQPQPDQQQQDQQQKQNQQQQQQEQQQNQDQSGTPTLTPQSGEQQQPDAGQGTPTPTPQNGEQQQPNAGQGTPTPTPQNGEQQQPGVGQGTPTPTPQNGEQQQPNAGQGTPTPTPQNGEQQQPGVGQGTSTPAPEGPEQVPAGLSAADMENMSREQALQLLGALAQDDQTLQEYLQKLQPTPSNPNVRDW